MVDPLAGSYFIERLTFELTQRARAVLSRIEEAGGMVRAIESGLAQSLIETCAAERQARVDRGQDVIVGVNRFQAAEQPSFALRRVDSLRVRQAQSERLEHLKRSRNSARVAQCLAELTE